MIESAEAWAVKTYGSVLLGDRRRTERVIRMATALARDPMGSFPKQLGRPDALKAAYRFLENPRVSYEHLMRPHLQQTASLMRQTREVLLIQDMSEIDYQHHPQTQGLGSVGDGRHHGYLLQSVLAVDPSTRAVLGLAAQHAFLRQPAPRGETNRQRAKRKQNCLFGLTLPQFLLSPTHFVPFSSVVLTFQLCNLQIKHAFKCFSREKLINNSLRTSWDIGGRTFWLSRNN